MRIIAVFSNPAHCRIEYIKLINPATSQVVTLDWDESEVSDGGLYGKGVHINYPEKDADLSEKHLNDLIKLGVFISMTCQELLDEE